MEAPKHIFQPAYVGSVRRTVAQYFPELRLAVFGEAKIAVSAYDPQREVKILEVAEATYQRLMNQLRDADFVVVSLENETSDQILVWHRNDGRYKPNYRLIFTVAQDCDRQLAPQPRMPEIYIG